MTFDLSMKTLDGLEDAMGSSGGYDDADAFSSDESDAAQNDDAQQTVGFLGMSSNHTSTPKEVSSSAGLSMINKLRQRRLFAEHPSGTTTAMRLKSYVRFDYEGALSLLLLSLLGVLSGIIAWTLDEAVVLLRSVTNSRSANLKGHEYLSYIAWSVFLAVISVCVTQRLAPEAAGSGIPEMKSYIAGFKIPGFLAPKTCVAKWLALTFALGSGGLALGREGPFVHMSCILVMVLLTHIPGFRVLKGNDNLQNQALAAASAVGVAGTFGSAIGGVLFSIETTSEIYHIKNYWKGFLASVFGAFTFRALSYFGNRENVVSLITTNFDALPYSFTELPLFCLLAAACGAMGGMFVRAFSHVQLRMSSLMDYYHSCTSTFARAASHPAAVAAVVALFFSLVQWPLGHYAIVDLRTAVNELVSELPLHRTKGESFVWSETPGVREFLSLFVFGIIRFVQTAISLNLAIPCGVFTPVFAVGAAAGRFFGELVYMMGPHSFSPGGYALVGAASFSSGVTGTVSTAVIVFEVTSQLAFALPVLLSVIIGRAVGAIVSRCNIYDAIARTKMLPTLPKLNYAKSGSIPVGSLSVLVDDFIMQRHVSLLEIRELVQRYPAVSSMSLSRVIPVIDAPNEKLYIGCVAMKEIIRLSRNDSIWSSSSTVDITVQCRLDRSNPALCEHDTLSRALLSFAVNKSNSIYVTDSHGRLKGVLSLADIASYCDEGLL